MSRRTGRLSRVHLEGFEGSVKHTLEYFFANHRTGKKYQIVATPGQADWVVFNADQPRSKSLLQDYFEQQLALPGIIVTVKELQWSQSVTLLKPFNVHQLEDAIQALMQLIDIQTKSAPSDLDRFASASSSSVTQPEPPVQEAEQQEATTQIEAPEESATQAVEPAEQAEPEPEKAEVEAIEQPEPVFQEEQPELTVQAKQSEQELDLPELPGQAQHAEPANTTEPAKEPVAPLEPSESDQIAPQPTSKVTNLEIAAKKRALLLARKKALLKKGAPSAGSSSSTSNAKSQGGASSRLPDAQTALGEHDASAKAKGIVAKLGNSTSAEKPLTARLVSEAGNVAPALQPAIEKKKAYFRNHDQEKKQSASKHHTNMVSVFGNLPELDWQLEADKRRLQINLDGMLLPWIQKIVEQGRSQRTSLAIDGLHLRLEYLPWTDCFVTNLSEEVLYTVMTSRFGLGELSVKEGDVIEDDLQDGLGFSERVISAENLLWMAGLWTVQGRVLPSDDPTKARRLVHVPECARQTKIAEVDEVINLWQSRRINAFRVIKELGIAQRFVFGVMAAATTAKLFEY